ncbi:MAG: DUF222 domain-containing protein [Actinomycetia bacterium]|nr:DUF222 domain-containing protein [Actinomycetes bacterium]MCP4960413.1 DUF222 domain-containing protein [Actinomycetes bacterium]
MSETATRQEATTTNDADPLSTGEELMALGWEINTNQYRLVHLAARFDEELEWYRQGLKSASHWIAERLQIQSSTAREWVRVGHALRHLPLIGAALAANEISYAKARILTRWADADSEERLLVLARERTANRLSPAIARALLDDGETDDERDARLHEARSVTTWTDGDGMAVVRIVLPPSVAKPVIAAVDELVRRIAETPSDCPADPSADAFGGRSVTSTVTESDRDPSADATGRPSVVESLPTVAPTGGEMSDSLPTTLRELRRRWQPANDDDWIIPSLAQQRADAFVALFMGLDVELTTEVVFHVRGDGATFGDGTPTTNSAIFRLLDRAFIRLLVHDAERRPINASSARRLPTTRQRRVVMEAHGHECVECQSTDLLVLHHEPPYDQTLHTVTHELEPRCAPCHRARHRFDPQPSRHNPQPHHRAA